MSIWSSWRLISWVGLLACLGGAARADDAQWREIERLADHKPFQEGALFEMLSRHLGVRFEEELDTPDEVDPIGLQTTPQALSADLRQALEQALITLDVDGIERAIDNIDVHHPAAAAMLRPMARDFDYDRMSGWLAGA